MTATGMNTEFGKIATMLQGVTQEDTPLQKNLDKMGKMIAYGALGLTAILAVLGIFRGHEILEMLIWGVSLAVAAVPEALPAVVTISLALGCAEDGQTPCPGPQTTFRGNAGFDNRHLLRQDRDSDTGPDDHPPHVCRREDRRSQRRRLRAEGRILNQANHSTRTVPDLDDPLQHRHPRQ